MKRVRIGAGAMALLCVTGGVARADPLPVADVRQAINTEDGWRVVNADRRGWFAVNQTAVPCGTGVHRRY